MDDLDEFGPPEHAWDALAPGAQEQDAEQRAEGVHEERDLPIDAENLDMYQGQQDRAQNVLQGGVGKSHVIKLIHYETMSILKLSRGFEPDEVPALLAAFNIDDMVLHSALSFGVGDKRKEYQALSSDKANTLRTHLGKLRLLIIDEISMVGSDMLCTIHRRLEEIARRQESDTRFGGVSILAVGDLHQLQPVGQSHVFSEPTDAFARLHRSLWKEKFEMIELTKSIRQKNDRAFSEILERVRTASCTAADIAILKSRQIEDDNPNYPQEALHIFQKNCDVDQHNEKHLSTLEGTQYMVKAHDFRKEKNTQQIEMNEPIKMAEAGGLQEVLHIAVGARVMLVVNLDVSDGFVNGACGTIVCIVSRGRDVLATLVRLKNDRVWRKRANESQYKDTFPGAVVIERHEVSFYVGRGRTHAQIARRQFPLRLAWASTIHKVQGKTLDTIVVCLTKTGRRTSFMAGQAYVAFSRVTSIRASRRRRDYINDWPMSLANPRFFNMTVRTGSKWAF
ncbi:hypothetical protein Pmani_011785 [Petrolisthes manimaculis]|uniref:ATP-dependent DNA helicase n=1 Tax=Petrolisthes manimaculis TaxID=1843537 RepID=A0AAE1UAV4_9EUCA|nr:hypothetical protein Pmani_011785 [Petrolisthes manimaculis]